MIASYLVSAYYVLETLHEFVHSFFNIILQ